MPKERKKFIKNDLVLKEKKIVKIFHNNFFKKGRF